MNRKNISEKDKIIHDLEKEIMQLKNEKNKFDVIVIQFKKITMI